MQEVVASIYKIVTREQWQQTQATNVFVPAAIDLTDGYIHFSTACQLRETAAKHFPPPADLLVLEVDAQAVKEQLRWEVSRGDDRFPHLYGNLPLATIQAVYPLPFNDRGQHVFPAQILSR